MYAVEGDLELLAETPKPPERNDLCLVLHTSGTTNKPKIVPLTHANVASGSLCIASTLQLRADDDRKKPEDVNLNVMPLFHIHGISINVLASLLSGTTVVASPGFDPESFFVAYSARQQYRQHRQCTCACSKRRKTLCEHGSLPTARDVLLRQLLGCAPAIRRCVAGGPRPQSDANLRDDGVHDRVSPEIRSVRSEVCRACGRAEGEFYR